MNLLILVSIFLGNFALAATSAYDLRMQLSRDGQLVSTPQIIVVEGKTASITQKSNGSESFIEVTATQVDDKNTKQVLLKFVIGSIGKNGKKTVTSRPQILAKLNEKSEIVIGETSQKTLSFSVVASKKTLSK